MTGRAHRPSLADRLALLEAREAIRERKYEYAALCDGGYDGAAIARLFTADGSWHSNVHGTIAGPAAIAAFMEQIGREHFPWAIHYVGNPRIDVDLAAGTARARWVLLQLASGTAADAHDASVVATGAYDDRLRLVDGEWRFASVTLKLGQVTDLRRGWPATAVLPAVGAVEAR
ncbi:MAG: nuclear transport factor 2 family protein [Patulibacter sp.]